MKLLYLAFLQSLTYNVSTENLNTKPSCTCTLSILLEFRVPYSLLGSVHNALFGKDIRIVCSIYTVFSELGEVQSGRIWENAVIIVDLACSDQRHKLVTRIVKYTEKETQKRGGKVEMNRGTGKAKTEDLILNTTTEHVCAFYLKLIFTGIKEEFFHPGLPFCYCFFVCSTHLLFCFLIFNILQLFSLWGFF